MPYLIIRKLPGETHRAIKARANRHGRSSEAENREILKLGDQPPGELKVGDQLATLGAAFGGIELETARSSKPMRAAVLK